MGGWGIRRENIKLIFTKNFSFTSSFIPELFDIYTHLRRKALKSHLKLLIYVPNSPITLLAMFAFPNFKAMFASVILLSMGERSSENQRAEYLNRQQLRSTVNKTFALEITDHP